MSLLTQIFGSRNQRLLKQYQKTVREINALEAVVEKLSDAELQAKTPAFKERIAKGESLDALLPEAFAVCREASKRVLKMRHFDVQLIGGMVLHNGKIAEMGTGEGKTLMATLPAYLNALAGLGVHIVTVNDYLAQRDAEWMGQIYRFLGLTVGVNLSQMENAAPACLRERGRGVLDPDRRGAHAAHHLRRGRRHDRLVHRHQPHSAQARAAEGREGIGRLLGRRE